MKKEYNLGFIDGQNLHMGTQVDNWKVDLFKFRTYLRDKYKVQEAYYFLGVLSEDNQNLYSDLQKAGFIVVFREHNQKMSGKKKGNVDTDIVFEMMKRMIDEQGKFSKIVLVSGDGDYVKTVNYLVSKDRFSAMLFPNGKFASSLYNKLDSSKKVSLNRLRKKLEYLGK